MQHYAADYKTALDPAPATLSDKIALKCTFRCCWSGALRGISFVSLMYNISLTWKCGSCLLLKMIQGT